MQALQLFHCLMGNHHRDRHKIVRAPSGDRSVCRGCGKPMVRDFGEWRVARAKDKDTA
jgi:hypothetical protein